MSKDLAIREKKTEAIAVLLVGVASPEISDRREEGKGRFGAEQALKAAVCKGARGGRAGSSDGRPVSSIVHKEPESAKRPTPVHAERDDTECRAVEHSGRRRPASKPVKGEKGF